ncbi:MULTISPECIES: hypothetical protein [Salinibacter]|nr:MULTISPECIES: hypothetical protein [Salinibacter]MCS3642180.1 hypothetical protein [Salinibacter ruber]MCS3821544.1 hypothetical protein [Salinibacter ruber]MCS4182584.1 hypothetical protein [Salinibacter ruber]MCS4190388.1 hypothetical protein [Salinibacter ruber]
MNQRALPSAIPSAVSASVGATEGRCAFARFYLGYVYVYFYLWTAGGS